MGGIVISPNGVRAILFDLDGTLHMSRPSSLHAFYDFAARLGVSDSAEKRLAAMRWTHSYWATSAELNRDLETYRGNEEAFWTNYSRLHLCAFGCTEDLAQELAPRLHDYMKTEYKPEDWVPPDVPATLQILGQAGFRLAVLSNRSSPCDDYLKTLNLLDFFDFAVVAGQVSSWKPEPEIFHHALERWELSPGEVIYVGDNYYADVVGARRAGLRPVLLDSEGLFPDAGCETIRVMGELPDLLSK